MFNSLNLLTSSGVSNISGYSDLLKFIKYFSITFNWFSILPSSLFIKVVIEFANTRILYSTKL